MKSMTLACMIAFIAAWSGLSFLGFRVEYMPMVEICDNALDDDGDGRIDLNDPDCVCPVLEPISLIPNPSFEEMECCPSNRSQMDCATTWIQASDATTDYIHQCDWLGRPEFPPPMPFPDGRGILGIRDGRAGMSQVQYGWKEYAGACLLSPLLAGIEYRFEFHLGFVNSISSPPLEITFFGTTDCSNLPFGAGDQYFGCPTNGSGWIRLASKTVSASGWVKTQLNVIPEQNIYGVAIGPPCKNTSASVSTYYFFDNLVLADEKAFGFKIEEINHLCSPDFRLTIPHEDHLTYQWYKDGIALIGEQSHELTKIYGEGKYQVRVLGERICNLTAPFEYRIPEYYYNLEVTICEGDRLPFGTEQLSQPGDYVGTFRTWDNCDSTVYLQLNVQGLQEEMVYVKIFEGEFFQIGNQRLKDEGEHPVSLLSSIGCDSLVRVQLDYYKLFFPNIFSPNKDGVNDRFEIYGPDLVSIEEFEIYGRWGKVLYNSNSRFVDESIGWDGTYQGEPLNTGVYGYIVSFRMDDNIERTFSGSILLLR